MLISYINEAMRLAKYEILEDHTYYGEIPGFQGVWANADSLDACREESHGRSGKSYNKEIQQRSLPVTCW